MHKVQCYDLQRHGILDVSFFVNKPIRQFEFMFLMMTFPAGVSSNVYVCTLICYKNMKM